MPAQLAIENPLLSDIKLYEPHKQLATELAALLPDSMIVTLEPLEGTDKSVLTISAQYKGTIGLDDKAPTAYVLARSFIDVYKETVNKLDASS